MTSGNGLSVPTRPSTSPPSSRAAPPRSPSTPACAGAGHDPEHQRYAQTSLSGVTLYISGAGVLAERFAGSGGTVRWTNFLVMGGRMIGIHVENSEETAPDPTTCIA
jgi:hypothetical protein